jgi:hypothetical protein
MFMLQFLFLYYVGVPTTVCYNFIYSETPDELSPVLGIIAAGNTDALRPRTPIEVNAAYLTAL